MKKKKTIGLLTPANEFPSEYVKIFEKLGFKISKKLDLFKINMIPFISIDNLLNQDYQYYLIKVMGIGKLLLVMLQH